jgi:hypothetical protein
MLDAIQEYTGFRPYAEHNNNMIQALLGYICDAVYSFHNDCEVNLSYRSSSYEDTQLTTEIKCQIPHAAFQSTLTLSFSDAGLTNNTTIQWKVDGMRPLKLELGDNDVSVQPHYVQFFSEHGVNINPAVASILANAIRLVLSFRCTIVPTTLVGGLLMDEVLHSIGFQGGRQEACKKCKTEYVYKNVVTALN